MNLEKLEVGKVFKNYKELCKELGLPVKGGKGRQYQLKDLERYCKYRKEGHKFIIEEVYNKPLKKTDNRGKSLGSRNNNGVYSDLIQLLILDLLVQGNNNGRVLISRSRLIEAMQLVNKNYYYAGENVPKLSQYADIDERTIYDFYNTSRGSFRNAINVALKSLESKKLIMYNVIDMISLNINKEDELPYDIYKEMTGEEKSMIMKIEKRLLVSMGYNDENEVRVTSDWIKYKKRLDEELRKYGINYYHKAYDITVNQEYIYEEYENLLDLLLDDNEREELKNKLNSRAYLRQKDNVRKRYGSYTSEKMSEVRTSPDYIEHSNLLIDLLIDINADNIKDYLETIETNPKDSDDEWEMIEIIESLK